MFGVWASSKGLGLMTFGSRMQGFLFVSFSLPFMVLRWCGDGVIYGGEIKMACVQFFFPLFQDLHCTVENCSGIESVKPVCNYEEEATHKGASYQVISTFPGLKTCVHENTHYKRPHLPLSLFNEEH